mmetsp:Transcript_127130/g.245111  ORF Transcript_127130/g.245111 Transcript_127130/m.245111 type:complete len:222 (-) Transcript_127130:475-1140(-)
MFTRVASLWTTSGKCICLKSNSGLLRRRPQVMGVRWSHISVCHFPSEYNVSTCQSSSSSCRKAEGLRENPVKLAALSISACTSWKCSSNRSSQGKSSLSQMGRARKPGNCACRACGLCHRCKLSGNADAISKVSWTPAAPSDCIPTRRSAYRFHKLFIDTACRVSKACNQWAWQRNAGSSSPNLISFTNSSTLVLFKIPKRHVLYQRALAEDNAVWSLRIS